MFSFFTGRARDKEWSAYERLMTASPDSSPMSPVGVGEERPSMRGTVLALLFCVVCTLINIGTLHRAAEAPPRPFPSRTTYFPVNSISRKEIELLRRPSQFIGLEALHREIPPAPKSFQVYPYVLSPVDQDQPAKVLGHDPKAYLSVIGTISPEDRQVKVSNKISTIMQFRALDFGMEACELNIRLPNTTDLSLPSSILDVYRLTQPTALHESTLSFDTRPPRKNKFGTVKFEHGMVWKHRFGCVQDELVTFELACPIGNAGTPGVCDVEWWQDREDPYPAVVLKQYSTL